jgi:tetratricopeptide (TPR) repeat protein
MLAAMPPLRYVWPRSRSMRIAFVLPVLALAGCSIVQGLLNPPEKAVANAEAQLKAGNLAEAARIYNEALARNPTHVDLASGAAYVKLLAGDTSGADAVLAAAEAQAGPRLAEIKMRRALVAMEGGDVDTVKVHAEAAGTPAAKLLVAEVDLANGYPEQAKPILESIQGEAGPVGAAATGYLDLLNDASQPVQGLADMQALWALGQRGVAAKSVKDNVLAYAESRADGDEQILLWAGRAATVGETGIATTLLDAMSVAPPGQKWRVEATRAIVLCAEGKGADCVARFDELAAISPAEGLADARVTAAMIVASTDAVTAKQLLNGVAGDAAARALASLGEPAGGVAADPVFKAQLGG